MRKKEKKKQLDPLFSFLLFLIGSVCALKVMPLARRKKPQILLAWHTYNAWADWNHTDNASDHRQWKERQRINHFYIELVAKHRQPRYFLYTFVANILKYSQRTHRHHAPKICCSAFLITWATLLFFILLPSLTLITTIYTIFLIQFCGIYIANHEARRASFAITFFTYNFCLCRSLWDTHTHTYANCLPNDFHNTKCQPLCPILCQLVKCFMCVFMPSSFVRITFSLFLIMIMKNQKSGIAVNTLAMATLYRSFQRTIMII